MGYPEPLKAVSRKISDNVVTVSTPFWILGRFGLGARMALIEHEGEVIVWSAIPHGADTNESLKLLTGKDSGHKVTYLIIPNAKHYLAAKSWKEAYPDIKIIGAEGTTVPGVEFDYLIPEAHGNKLIGKEELTGLGIGGAISDNLQFVSLPHHKSKELVVYDTKSKALFNADLIFNLGLDRHITLEQFSPEVGFEKGYTPFTGFSFVFRYLYPGSYLTNLVNSRLVKPALCKPGLQAIYDLDFTSIVMTHGNIIDTDAKSAFKTSFEGYL